MFYIKNWGQTHNIHTHKSKYWVAAHLKSNGKYRKQCLKRKVYLFVLINSKQFQEKMCHLFCLVSLGTIMLWKVGSVDSSGVQNLFCMTSGSRVISKTILGIRSQKIEMIKNPISWNQILPWFIHNLSSYEHFRRLEHIPFQKWHFLGMLQVQPHFWKT